MSQSQPTSLMEDVIQTLKDRKHNAHKNRNSKNQSSVRKPEKNAIFSIKRFILSWIFPEYNNFSQALKLRSAIQTMSYLLLAFAMIVWGSYHLCGVMMPWLEHTALANHLGSPLLQFALVVLPVFLLIISPAILLLRLICTMRDRWSEKLENALKTKDFRIFEAQLYQMATKVSPVIFETLLTNSLKFMELESYQILLEFNHRYQIADLQVLDVKEHARQYEQVDICYGGTLFMIDNVKHKDWMKAMESYFSYANRQTYDFLKLCFREHSTFRLKQNGNLKASQGEEGYQRFMAFFQYLVTQYKLENNAMIQPVFEQCQQLHQYQFLLERHRLKNRLYNKFHDTIHDDSNMKEEAEEDPESVMKI